MGLYPSSRSSRLAEFVTGLGAVGIILGVFALIVFAICLPTIVVYYVWNAFVVVQFGMKPIGWFVAFCIAILLGMIFKGTTIQKTE